jgi:hypothetical protein
MGGGIEEDKTESPISNRDKGLFSKDVRILEGVEEEGWFFPPQRGVVRSVQPKIQAKTSMGMRLSDYSKPKGYAGQRQGSGLLFSDAGRV